MVNPENPFDRAEKKRGTARDSSLSARIKRKIKEKQKKQKNKEAKK